MPQFYSTYDVVRITKGKTNQHTGTWKKIRKPDLRKFLSTSEFNELCPADTK